MATAPHLGEFRDDESYTHFRVASRLGVSSEWVRLNMLFPSDEDGNRVPGVPCRKVGKFFFVTGEAIRFWLEGGSAPDMDP